MKKICCAVCGKYRKFEKSEILHLLEKAVLSIIYRKCKNENQKFFSILGLIENI